MIKTLPVIASQPEESAIPSPLGLNDNKDLWK
jgi:hypothetical protein